LIGDREGKRRLGDVSIYWRIILKFVLKKQGSNNMLTEWYGLEYELVSGYCEHVSSPSCSTEGGKLLTFIASY